MNTKIIVVVKGVVLFGGKVLIVKREDNDDIGAGTWECAGGEIDFGEDLEDALKREVKEEAGIDISVEELLYATAFKTDPTRQVVILTYKARAKDDLVKLSHEHSAYVWASEKEFKELIHKPILDDMERFNAFRSIFAN